MDRSERMSLVRWGGWFFLSIGALFGLIGLRYLSHYSWPTDLVARVYTVLAFVSHFGVLALAPWFLVVLPLTLLVPARRLVMALSVFLAAAALAALLVDSLVFAEDRFHLSALALAVLGARTLGFGLLYFAMFLALCGFYARSSWPRLAKGSGRSLAATLACGVFLPFAATQVIHVWADAHYYVPITSFTPYLPLFQPWIAKTLVARWAGVVDLEQSRDASQMAALAEQPLGLLHYPLEPLRCTRPAHLPNILVIGLDAMRADAVDPRLTPNVVRFSERSLRFENHWSGGNGTRPGLFSLFYALPPTYWRAFYAEQQSPVLIDQLQAAGYELALFPGNPPDRIVGLDRTAFRHVSNLFTTTNDADAAQGWIHWLDGRDPARPFFGFVFFESAPGGCHAEYLKPTEVAGAPPREERRSCYDTALRFADVQAGKVLDDLEHRGLLDDTIVIVTSDHGEEFDENGQGFRGHGSSYSRYQLRTPMIIRWPGREAGAITRRTSHNDVAPTLLSDVLGCANPPGDYSSGGNLFSGPGWDWFVAASYTGFAVVEPERVTVSSGVYFETRDANYRLLADPRLDHEVILRAIRETSRFYRN